MQLPTGNEHLPFHFSPLKTELDNRLPKETEYLAELEAWIDREFERYAELMYTHIQRDLAEFNHSQQDIGERIARKKVEFDSYDFIEKVAELANNMAHWVHPQLRQIRLTFSQPLEENKADLEQLFKDIDQIVASSGYTQEDIALLKNDHLTPEQHYRRYVILAEIYRAMFQKGYNPDHQELRSLLIR